MTQPIGVAMIGCGLIAEEHARGYARNDVRLRWAVDVRADRAAAARARWGADRAGGDYRVALVDPEVDTVDLCLPHDLHAPIAIAAAQAGKHVLVEKPLADSLAAADAMIAAADAAGVVLMVAENVRYDPLYQKAKELLDAGTIGTPALAQVTRECYLTGSFREERPWFLDARRAAGGIMMSGGVHDFELLRMLFGEVASVYALRAPSASPRWRGTTPASRSPASVAGSSPPWWRAS